MLAASGSAVAKADAVHQTAHSVLPASAIRKVSRLPPWCLWVHADFKLLCQKVVIDEDEPKPSETPHAAWPKLLTKDDQGLPVLCACFRLRQLRKHSVQCKHPLQRPTWHKASGQENLDFRRSSGKFQTSLCLPRLPRLPRLRLLRERELTRARPWRHGIYVVRS